MSTNSRYGSIDDDSPGLAPSVASDSASSEGHLESPPHSAVPMDVSTITSTDLAGPSKSPTENGLDSTRKWIPGEHTVNQQVYLQEQASYSNRRLPETRKANTTSLDALSSDSHSAPGSPQTVEQYSRDVSAFLMWAAEPHLEERKRTGFMVLIFLLIFTGLIYLTKKSVYASNEH